MLVAGKVTAGLAESNGSLPPGGWLTVTCRLTACTPGSALGPTLSIEYGKPPFNAVIIIDARWPCDVCGRGDGSNSIECASCQKWVHKKCSGIKGSMYRVMKSFICRGCSNPVTSTGRTSVDIGASANLEFVDKFCYLGDTLSVDGDADAAVEARIRIGWNKFLQLVPLLTNRDISLIRRGRLCSSCVRSSMLHGSETWPVRKEWGGTSASRDENGQMDVWCKVKDKVLSKELSERLGIDYIILVLQQNRLQWYGHVLRKADTDWVKKCMEYEVEGSRPRGRPKRSWRKVVQKKIVKHVNWPGRMLWIIIDCRSW